MPRSPLKPITVRQLEAFRALMLAGTTVGGARLIGISQPAMSRLITQLESGLRFAVFDRALGRLTPTPEGHLLYEEVERTFASVDKIREMAAEIRNANAGRITLACLPALALGFVPDVIRRFRERHPRVSISLTIQISAKVEELAAAQQIDFGIAEYPFARSGIDIDDFCRTPMVLALPDQHRFSQKRKVRPRDLEGESFVSLTRATVGRHLIDRVFDEARVQRRLAVEAQFSAAVAALVAAGQGVGLIDPFTAADFVSRGHTWIAFEPEIEFHVGILYPTHRPLSRPAREFIGMLKAAGQAILRKRSSL